MYQHTHRIVVVVTLLGAGVLASCGDDADAGELTTSEFTEQVNSLCATEGQAIGDVVGPLFGDGEPSPTDMQEALDQVVALSRGLADDIRALDPPSEISDDVDALVDALDRGTDAAASHSGAAFFGGDDDPWSDATTKAQSLGLDACGPEG